MLQTFVQKKKNKISNPRGEAREGAPKLEAAVEAEAERRGRGKGRGKAEAEAEAKAKVKNISLCLFCFFFLLLITFVCSFAFYCETATKNQGLPVYLPIETSSGSCRQNRSLIKNKNKGNLCPEG